MNIQGWQWEISIKRHHPRGTDYGLLRVSVLVSRQNSAKESQVSNLIDLLTLGRACPFMAEDLGACPGNALPGAGRRIRIGWWLGQDGRAQRQPKACGDVRSLIVKNQTVRVRYKGRYDIRSPILVI